MAKIVIALGGNALGNTPEEQLKLITGTATSSRETTSLSHTAMDRRSA